MSQNAHDAGHPTDPGMPGDLGFVWQRRKSGEVVIHHHGRLAATLRGRAAAEFLAMAERVEPAVLQQRMARLTGNYRRGNEATAVRHPRSAR